jgi:hypothetical protein
MSVRNLNNPQELWNLFLEYENNLPIIEVPQSHVKLGVVYLPIKAPMTMEGFKDFCYDKVGVIKHYIDNTEGNYSDYCTIIARIKERIFNNNMSKAAAGMYKENLIARQLGMVDKNQTQVNIEQPLFNDIPKNDSNKQDS